MTVGTCFHLVQYLLLGITGPTYQYIGQGQFVNLSNPHTSFYEATMSVGSVQEAECPKKGK